jgi:hypothetical protein
MATVLSNPIKEAERYLQNARQILSEKAGKDGDSYSDPKYVRMAGNTLWNGVLIALDGALGVRDKLKGDQRPDIKDYQNAVAKTDKKMTRSLQNAYLVIHQSLGYDGVTRYKIVQDALLQGKEMIAWAGKYYNPKKVA